MSYTQIETAIFEGTPVPAHVAGDDEDYTYEPVQVATISREELAALRQSVQEAEALAADRLDYINELTRQRDEETRQRNIERSRSSELEAKLAAVPVAALWRLYNDFAYQDTPMADTFAALFEWLARQDESEAQP